MPAVCRASLVLALGTFLPDWSVSLIDSSNAVRLPRSLHYAASAQKTERRKMLAAPVGMTRSRCSQRTKRGHARRARTWRLKPPPPKEKASETLLVAEGDYGVYAGGS